MKKILIIMPSMFIGGAERSLLGLLENMDYEQVEVSLFLYRHEGEFLKYIPRQVKILPEMAEYRTFDVPIASLICSSRFRFGIARIFGKIAQRLHVKRTGEPSGVWMSMQYISAFLQPLLPKIPGRYDLGIMFLGVADTLVNKVDASVKMTWNHTDYDSLYPDRRRDLATYAGVDAVISVSDACSAKVLKYYPELDKKAITIGNCLAKNLIVEQSLDKVEDYDVPEGCIRILSIGRYSDAKNFDNIPAICRMIREMGKKVRWFIIGYGADTAEQLIRDRIAEEGMDDYVILLGKKINPYPYIRQCDLYVQPSRYEGKCVSVIEAQILKKPVVITRYDTSHEQLADGVDGVIVPMDNEECAKGIVSLLDSPERCKMLAENCGKCDYSNALELEKILKWITG